MTISTTNGNSTGISLRGLGVGLGVIALFGYAVAPAFNSETRDKREAQVRAQEDAAETREMLGSGLVFTINNDYCWVVEYPLSGCELVRVTSDGRKIEYEAYDGKTLDTICVTRNTGKSLEVLGGYERGNPNDTGVIMAGQRTFDQYKHPFVERKVQEGLRRIR